ncbi:MAG: transcriptional regulator, LysR family [Verrucomicrobiales bacterium]|nr:transcriptional regulator, LysR family [Verrucomicrobiales bacterium]
MFDSLLSRSGLTLDRLKTLVEVEAAGSIVGAGPGNPAKHSQYSRQLRELSEFFGCELSERQGRTVRLTERGVFLARLSHEFLQKLEDYDAECSGDHVEYTIGGGDSLIQWLVMPHIAKVVDAVPNIRLSTASLSTQNIIEKVTNCRLDIGLVRETAPTPGLQSARLGSMRYRLAIPRSLLAGTVAPTIAQAFRELPMAMQVSSGEFTTTLQSITKSLAMNFRAALSCQSLPQVLAAVKSRRYAAVLPEIAAQELPKNTYNFLTGRELAPLNSEICLIWNPRVMSVRPYATALLVECKTALLF